MTSAVSIKRSMSNSPYAQLVPTVIAPPNKLTTSTAALFRQPRHPYTSGLLSSSPRLGDKRSSLPTIPGMVPAPGQRGAGCYFAARCPRAEERCRVETPALSELDPGHEVACWNPVP